MRRLLPLAACVGLGGCSVLAPVTEILAPKPFFAPPSDLEAQMVAIEAETGGRLGAFVIDADGKSLLAYRADERFAMCSTFKTLLAAMVLEGVQQGSYDLDQPLTFDAADLVSYSPYVERYAAVGSVTLGGAAGAAVSLSDNSAANLLYDLVGGPGTLFQWLRTTGDKMSWPSRLEPDLNENAAGDMRDTTTPAAIGKTLHRLLTGNRLNNISKASWKHGCVPAKPAARGFAPACPRGGWWATRPGPAAFLARPIMTWRWCARARARSLMSLRSISTVRPPMRQRRMRPSPKWRPWRPAQLQPIADLAFAPGLRHMPLGSRADVAFANPVRS